MHSKIPTMETTHIQKDNERNVGEMFTASILKKVTPVNQFLFAVGISFLVMLLGKFVFDSKDVIKYAGTFGIVFFVMFNPWLSLLRDDSKKYFFTSIALYVVISAILLGLMFVWADTNFQDLDVKLILISCSFYIVVAYGMMTAIKQFVNWTGGGI